MASFTQASRLVGTRWGADVHGEWGICDWQCHGFAMAASEDADPLPSVEVPEGADILPKERSTSLRLIICLTGQTA